LQSPQKPNSHESGYEEHQTKTSFEICSSPIKPKVIRNECDPDINKTAVRSDRLVFVDGRKDISDRMNRTDRIS
jgi:hypothetical protein